MLLYQSSLLLLLLFAVAAKSASNGSASHGKLLYILLDGFRYDYVDDLPADQLPGFNEIISKGVKAKWVHPLCPTLSYPSWTTLVTGLYAESHNIIGNHFYDDKDRDVFSLFDVEATGKAKWWTAEPIWTTATKAGLRVALYLWSRCDVPIGGVLPEVCKRFSKVTGPEVFKTNIDKALKKFDDGFDLVQVYTEHLDNIGHSIGPETDARRQATREVDAVLVYLQDKLREKGLEDEVNIVVVSDHGMASIAPGDVTERKLDEYLPAGPGIVNIADYGTFINIKVERGHVDKVYRGLSAMPGVNVYKRNDVPEHFHLTGSKYLHDILIMAKPDNFVMASTLAVQLNKPGEKKAMGIHGYDPSFEKMRSIFYAKGPAFKANMMLDPINIVDIYQVLTKVLNIEPRPHNGTWNNVKEMFSSAAPSGPWAGVRALVVAVVAVVWTFNRS